MLPMASNMIIPTMIYWVVMIQKNIDPSWYTANDIVQARIVVYIIRKRAHFQCPDSLLTVARTAMHGIYIRMNRIYENPTRGVNIFLPV